VRVLFISANRSEVNMRTVPLGLGCVAEAARQAGHEVRVIDLMRVSDAFDRIRDAIGERRSSRREYTVVRCGYDEIRIRFRDVKRRAT
jgi:precorrin-2 methylase